MKIVGIFALWALLVFCNMANADVHGFKTLPWQDCVREKQCHAMQPKEWSSEEIVFLKNTLQKFKDSGLSEFINQIQKNGIVSLERSSFWYNYGTNPFIPVYSENNYIHAMTSQDGSGNILFTDKFFNNEVTVDTVSGIDMNELTLLHELAHAYDHQGRFSKNKEFYELAGFKNFTGDLYMPQYIRASEFEMSKITFDSRMLNDQNQKLDAHQAEREFGMSKGLPRLYSTGNPAEAFADVVAFIYFDKHAKEYMSAELIKFIDANVLKGARAK